MPRSSLGLASGKGACRELFDDCTTAKSIKIHSSGLRSCRVGKMRCRGSDGKNMRTDCGKEGERTE